MTLHARPSAHEGAARRRVRALLEQPDHGAAARALVGPDGLWAACREAARADDPAFLEDLADGGVAGLIDDELPAFPGPTAAARAASLIALAGWWTKVRRPTPFAAGRLIADLEQAAAAYRPPTIAPWSAQDGAPVLLDAPVGTRPLLELIAELVRTSGSPGLVVVHDLLTDIADIADIAGTTSGGVRGGAPPPAATVRVALSSSGIGRTALLRLRPSGGTLGLYLDVVAAPFLRWDRQFERALQRAWWAAGQPELAARWSLHWEDSGAPVDLVEGASAGLAVALAAARLARGEPGGDTGHGADTAIVCGDIAESGEVLSVLGREQRLNGLYRNKLRAVAAGPHREFVLPAADQSEVGPFATRAGLAIDLRPVARLDELLGAVEQRAAGTADACPYKGLAFFTEDDARWFHGRERTVAQLIRRLRTEPLVGLVGPSGAGKSSLVRAGLLPALRRGAIPGSKSWEHVVLTPGTDAWAALRTALDDRLPPLEAAGPTSPVGLDDPDPDPDGFDGPEVTDGLAAGWLARMRARGTARPTLLVVLDQFEELFTLCPPAQVGPLLQLIAQACDEHLGLRFVPVVRADYYANVIGDERFAELLSDEHVLVGPMTRAELRRAITAPAAAAGLRIEPALVDAVFEDVVDQPAALPYLSTALQETWARRRDGSLTLAGYLDSGGVAHAIAKLADDVVSTTTPGARPELRALFLRLLETEDTQLVVRRPGRIEELTSAQQALVPDLLDRRLLVADGSCIELAHDSLVQAWPTLREWLAEEHDDLRLHGALARRAREWDHNQRNPDLLERGTRLSAFTELADRRADRLNDVEADFVAASDAARRQQDAARHAAAARTRRLLVATCIGLVVALVGASAAASQWRRAEHRTDDAQQAQQAQEAGEQAARAQGVLRGDSRARAALLSLAALDAAPNFEAVAGLAAALSSFERPIDTRPAHADDIVGGHLSLDGRLLVTGGVDDTIRLWDTATLTEQAAITADPPATAFALDEGSRSIAATSCDLNIESDPCPAQPVRVWSDVMTGTEPAAEVTAPDSRPPDATWETGYGNRMAAWLSDGRLVVAHREGLSFWTAAGQPAGGFISAAELGSDVLSVASHDGGLLAVGTEAGTVRWWRPGSEPSSLREVAADGAGPVYALAFSADGRWLAAGDGHGLVRILDTATGAARFATALKGPVDEPLWSMAFSPDGTKLLAGGGARPARQRGDDDLRLWSMDTGLLIRRYSGLADVVRTVGFRADGRVIAVTADRRIRLFEDEPIGLNWELAGQQRCGSHHEHWWLTETDRCWLTSVVMRPDQQTFVTAGWDRRITLWDRATRTALATASDPGSNAEVPYWTWSKQAALSSDGSQAATPTDDGGVQLWEIGERSITPTVRLRGTAGLLDAEGEQVLVNSAAFSPDGSRVATAAQDGAVDLWSAEDGEHLWHGSHGPPTWNLPTYATSLTFAPDGHHVVSAGGDARIRLWDVADGTVRVTPELSYVQTATAWSADGTTLFSAGADGLLRVWDPELRLQREFSLGSTAIPSAAFTGGSSLLVVTDQERVVRVVDVVSGRQLAAFPIPWEPLGVTVSDDGSEIIVADKGGDVTSYVGPSGWASAACALSERNLSRAEWDSFVGPERPYVRLCPDLPSGDGAPADAPGAANLEANIAASLRPRS